MSFIRIIAAAVVGGVIVFVWGAASHMILPIGNMGIQNLPSEESLLPAMRQVISQRGFYFFPGVDESNMSEASMKAWEAKVKTGPRGVLIYDPSGDEVFSPRQLGMELGSNILGALLLAIVLAYTATTWSMRALLATIVGIFAWASIDVSYWNWYRFPTKFTIGSLIDQGVGWFLGGLAIAMVFGSRRIESPPDNLLSNSH